MPVTLPSTRERLNSLLHDLDLGHLATPSHEKEWRPPAEAHSPMCQGCGLRRADHEHHREHKAMGGRSGAARVRSEARTNKIFLCRVCHAASHLERLYDTDGFACERCPLLQQCYWGLRTLGLPTPDGLAPGW